MAESLIVVIEFIRDDLITMALQVGNSLVEWRMIQSALELETLCSLPIGNDGCLVNAIDERQYLDFVLTVTHDPGIVMLAAPPPGVQS